MEESRPTKGQARGQEPGQTLSEKLKHFPDQYRFGLRPMWRGKLSVGTSPSSPFPPPVLVASPVFNKTKNCLLFEPL